MKNASRILFLILALALSCSMLCACGKRNEKQDEAKDDDISDLIDFTENSTELDDDEDWSEAIK